MTVNGLHYTRHGLHVNNLGKDWLTNSWGSKIKELFSNMQVTPSITLSWNNVNESLLQEQMDLQLNRNYLPVSSREASNTDNRNDVNESSL
jgi:hypothetical protein